MYRIFEQQKTRRACTFAQSCQIMFELLSSCEWEYLLSTSEKSEKKPALTTLVSSHAQKLKVIRPASYVTMVVGAIYCDKIVHTKKKLLLTTWQTCINAYSYASLKSNRALIYRIEGTVTVNFKMLKDTIFVGYQNRNFHLQNVRAKLPSSSNIHSSQNWHRCSDRRRSNDTWTSFHHCCFYQAILILW